jgi:hypothetical protein
VARDPGGMRRKRFAAMWRVLREGAYSPILDDDPARQFDRYMHMERGPYGVLVHTALPVLLVAALGRDEAYSGNADFERLAVLDLDTGDLVEGAVHGS